MRLEPVGDAPFNELHLLPLGNALGLPPEGFEISLAKSGNIGELCVAISDHLGVPSSSLGILSDGRLLDAERSVSANGISEPGAAARRRGKHSIQLTLVFSEGAVPSMMPALARVSSASVRSLWQEPGAAWRQFAARPALAALAELHAEAAVGPWLRGAACTATGQRPSNEDAHICACDWCGGAVHADAVDMPCALFAVCDGHGGGIVSEQVAEQLGAVLYNRLLECDTRAKEGRKTAFMDAYREMDVKIRDLHGTRAWNTGSTCIAACIWPPDARSHCRVVLANLGDSRGLLYRVGKDVLVETLDHKPSSPAEKARIENAGGRVLSESPTSPSRIDGDLSVSRAFGDFSMKADETRGESLQKVSSSPDVHEFEANIGDFLILGCDGLFDVVSSLEVAAITMHELGENSRHDGSPAEAAATLTWAALQRDSTDNVTSIVVQLGC